MNLVANQSFVPASGVKVDYCGYELSPMPKMVYCKRDKHGAFRCLLLNFFQKSWAFRGRSPWPVVEMQKRTTGYRSKSL